MKHTPLPWTTDELGNVNGKDTGYGELRIATVENTARTESLANGNFIARAVNNHYNLINTLYAVMWHLDARLLSNDDEHAHDEHAQETLDQAKRLLQSIEMPVSY